MTVQHVLYQPGDHDTPNFIKKRDGGVLQLCRVCGLGEMRLVEPCVAKEKWAVWPKIGPRGERDRLGRWIVVDEAAPGRGTTIIADYIRTESTARIMAGAREAGSIIRSLLTYVEVLESTLDAADESLAAEGGCGTREWCEGSPDFVPRDERLSYVRDDAAVSAVDEAQAYLGVITV